MSTYRFKTTPYKHQYLAVKRLLKQGYGGALLMEPRTGKTKTTIDWLSILYQQGKVKQALIVCPNRVMGTWVSEFHIHSPRAVHITVWDKDERARGIPQFIPGVLNVILVNYEAFGTPGRKLASGRRSKASGRFHTRSLLLKWIAKNPGKVACVLDESHKIKSPSSKQGGMIVSMAPSFPYRVILTGTPITKAKRAFDVYMQWQFLNPDRFSDLPTAALFKSHYGRWITDNGYPQWIAPRNMNELRARMAEDAIIVRRDQCFDLPPREDIVHYVELSKETRSIYDRMAREMVAEIEEGVYAEASIQLVLNLRLSQLTSGFIKDEHKQIRRIGLDKANALELLMEDRFELDEKLVVVARYKEDLNLIEELGRTMKVPVWSIRGDVTRQQSDEGLFKFRTHDGAALMVLQPAAASLGIDLSSASHMIWYSHTSSWVNFSQTCDRIALSRTSTTFTHLVAKHSVDEILLSTLTTDGDVAKAIMTHPRELINGRTLNLDEANRLKGLGDFQFTRGV